VIGRVNEHLRGSVLLLIFAAAFAWLCLLFVYVVIGSVSLLILSALNGGSWAENGDRASPVFCALLIVGTMLLLVRVIMRGAVVSEQGIMLRSIPKKQRFIPWSEVTSVDTHAIGRGDDQSDVYSVRIHLRDVDWPVTIPARWGSVPNDDVRYLNSGMTGHALPPLPPLDDDFWGGPSLADPPSRPRRPVVHVLPWLLVLVLFALAARALGISFVGF
jgi:hypothetical protein